MNPSKLPHHKFAKEFQFKYEHSSKLYSIHAIGIIYSMPYVITLRLKRHFTNIPSPTSDQLKDWYNYLPTKEKSLVKLSVLA